ncbi:hypothetical protein EVAR_20669_1 [Eumeta japonica]|uniref:(+)RNA virus helicase C-terminal domain-containing protein n=1 Tax=Eumeta variegata TaxID=151549 RepID=A0A4C1V9B7_EUMVA|nr:hypothetical protein EVAR_20669_1 [Eumeta japonica]
MPNEEHNGIYPCKIQVRSLQLKRYSDTKIRKDHRKTLYLTHTQIEKKSLIAQEFRKREGSLVLSVHEAQGLTSKGMIILRTMDSVPHAVVTIVCHTIRCVYYIDESEVAIDRLIKKAVAASENKIKDYNAKMAIRNRDKAVIDIIMKR